MALFREAVLDTSVLVAHIRKLIDLADYAEPDGNWYVSVISQGELVQGVLKSSHAKINETRLRQMLRGMSILPVTEETAERYARIASELESRGATIPQNDIWIAACALEHELSPGDARQPFPASERLAGAHVVRQVDCPA